MTIISPVDSSIPLYTFSDLHIPGASYEIIFEFSSFESSLLISSSVLSSEQSLPKRNSVFLPRFFKLLLNKGIFFSSFLHGIITDIFWFSIFLFSVFIFLE